MRIIERCLRPDLHALLRELAEPARLSSTASMAIAVPEAWEVADNPFGPRDVTAVACQNQGQDWVGCGG